MTHHSNSHITESLGRSGWHGHVAAGAYCGYVAEG